MKCRSDPVAAELLRDTEIHSSIGVLDKVMYRSPYILKRLARAASLNAFRQGLVCNFTQDAAGFVLLIVVG